MNPSSEDILRFEKKINKTETCWLWTATARSPMGHGGFYFKRKTLQAHRFAYEIWNGKIPDGLLVCHKCDNPPCVNPDHLFLGTHRDNTEDRINKGRILYNWSGFKKYPSHTKRKRKQKEICIRGHNFRANEKFLPGGQRYCSICRKINDRNAYLRKTRRVNLSNKI